MGVYVYMSVRQWCFFSWMHIGDFMASRIQWFSFSRSTTKSSIYNGLYIPSRRC